MEVDNLVFGDNDKNAISFSLDLINAAALVVIAAIGSNKATMVRRSLESENIALGDLPVAQVMPVRVNRNKLI